MKNIELKIFLGDKTEELRVKIKKLGADFTEELKQVDIYFNCESGRLKIREINDRKSELICYERLNNENSKISNYQIADLQKKQAGDIKGLLSTALGVKGVVKKIRELWIYKNTRIHIDSVEELGNFLELETVMGDRDIEEMQKEHGDIINILGLDKFKKISESYSDLLGKKYGKK